MTLETFKTISIADPALDIESMGASFGAWVLERSIEGARIVPGQQARVFELGHIDMQAFRTYVAAVATHEANGHVTAECAYRAFECGVARVHMEDGRVVEPAREETLASGAVRRRWKHEQMDELFSFAEVHDIGSMMYARAQLGKGRKVRYPLPPGLGHVLTSRVQASAAADASEAPTDHG